jgi:hypothetical protein
MTASDQALPQLPSPRDKSAALRATDWLALGASPSFALMAALTRFFSDGAHEILCSVASHAWVLSGMAPMYVLMSLFHLTPWLNLISRWRLRTREASPPLRAIFRAPLAGQRSSQGVCRNEIATGETHG